MIGGHIIRIYIRREEADDLLILRVLQPSIDLLTNRTSTFELKEGGDRKRRKMMRGKRPNRQVEGFVFTTCRSVGIASLGRGPEGPILSMALTTI